MKKISTTKKVRQTIKGVRGWPPAVKAGEDGDGEPKTADQGSSKSVRRKD